MSASISFTFSTVNVCVNWDSTSASVRYRFLKNYLLNIDFLDFKIIEDVGHGLKSEKLASTDILLTLT